MTKSTNAVLLAVTAGAVAWFLLSRRVLAGSAPTLTAGGVLQPETRPPITAGTPIPLGSRTTAFVSSITRLAGQGTSGGSTAQNPSTGGGASTIGKIAGWAGVVGGIVALGAAIVSIRRNDTKLEREEFARQAGFVSFDAMMRAVGWGTTNLGGALFVEGTQRIGKKDREWNQDFLTRVSRALYGEVVHAYLNDPTKGAQPVA